MNIYRIIKIKKKFFFLPFDTIKYLINYDWIGQYVPLLKEGAVVNIISAAIILIFLILMAIFNVKKIKQKSFVKNTFLLVSSLYVLTFPAASIIPGIQMTLMNTRVLYLASIPLSILIAYLLIHDRARMNTAKIATASF